MTAPASAVDCRDQPGNDKRVSASREAHPANRHLTVATRH
jgi:hypothetical protein